MAKLVLFDVDGTLVNTGGAGKMAFARTLEAAFNSHKGVHMVKFAGRTDVSLVRELFGIHGIPVTHENFKFFFDHYAFCLDRVMAEMNGQPCPGVKKFIRDLQTLPNPPVLGLLTGNIRLGAEIKLRHYDLWEPFHFGGFADDHEERNHIAVAAFERGRRVLGKHLKPEEIVVVGDTQFDVACGRFIGARVLAVATGGATRPELHLHKPDWLVDDLSQFNIEKIYD
jgi:phosphoglycolate phosphatase